MEAIGFGSLRVADTARFFLSFSSSLPFDIPFLMPFSPPYPDIVSLFRLCIVQLSGRIHLLCFGYRGTVVEFIAIFALLLHRLSPTRRIVLACI